MDRLTAEQSQVLDFLKRERQVNISGCAGSGKTLVAVETANRLDREGFKVLILCHNPYLAENIRSRVAGTGIVVYNITAYVESILNDETYQAETLLFNEPRRIKSWTDKDKSWTQFDSPSLYNLKDAIVKLEKGDHFDAVIIDEGQDFHPDWWELIEASLKDPVNGILYLFFDDNQANDPFGSRFKFNTHITLTKNCRNSGEILELVSKFYDDVPETNEELVGQGVVQEYIYRQEEELFDKIREAFISAEKYSPHLKDIVVISADPANINENQLKGLVIDTPKLKSEGYKVGINWQTPVIKYLKGHGLAEYSLSKSSIPTEKDIKAVTDFCRKRNK